jgi:hypothetical protein
VCVISSVMLFGIHGYPSDYFRFTPEAFRSMLGGFDHVWTFGTHDPDIPREVFGVGVKGCALQLNLERLPRLAAYQRHWEDARDAVRIGPLRVPPGDLARILRSELPRLALRRPRR